MSRHVIARKYLPIRAVSFEDLLVVYLVLDHFNASGWVWGVTCTLYGALAIASWCVKGSEIDAHPSEIRK